MAKWSQIYKICLQVHVADAILCTNFSWKSVQGFRSYSVPKKWHFWLITFVALTTVSSLSCCTAIYLARAGIRTHVLRHATVYPSLSQSLARQQLEWNAACSISFVSRQLKLRQFVTTHQHTNIGTIPNVLHDQPTRLSVRSFSW